MGKPGSKKGQPNPAQAQPILSPTQPNPRKESPGPNEPSGLVGKLPPDEKYGIWRVALTPLAVEIPDGITYLSLE